MEQPLLHGQTPVEFFSELVGDALVRQHLRASNLTEYYLVNLLCQQISVAGAEPFDDAGEPLSIRLGRALAAAGREQRSRLRRLGDFTLFVAGFLPESLEGQLVDVDYYQSIGEYAYGSLSQADAGTLNATFSELASNFVAFTDVLAEVSDRTLPHGDPDLLRLYDSWLRTGSERRARQLLDRGVMPNRPAGSRYVQ